MSLIIEKLWLMAGLLLLCSLSVANAAASGGRTLYVAPEPLSKVAENLQFRTIGEAAKAVEPGDTVLIYTGVYRESVVIEKSGTAQQPIRFAAAPAANVIITGADRILQWTKEGEGEENIFSTEWPHRFITWSKTGTHPGDDYHRLIGRAEQVFIDNYPLQQVLRREQLSRGTFFVDLDAKRLYAWASNNAKLGSDPTWSPRVEAATRSVLWESKGDYVELGGIRFRYAANQAQQAAAQFHGRHDVVVDCVFEHMNSIGAGFFAPDQIVRRCTFQDNGQMGWSANHAHNLFFTECLTRNNNIKNFSRGWEAGGDKIVLCRDIVIEKSRFIENRGVGIWFDIGNEASTVR
ncbi:MAG: right-handed parallel beta-helix repeat-containing protein, partial [Armatimonadota bacterium]|nr:right-handed parallel beta-helix repeat-containing protein [Armatimonadota bacterium]